MIRDEKEICDEGNNIGNFEIMKTIVLMKSSNCFILNEIVMNKILSKSLENKNPNVSNDNAIKQLVLNQLENAKRIVGLIEYLKEKNE